MAIIRLNNNIETGVYPKIDDIDSIDKKIKELDNKINKIARVQAKKAWIGSRKGKRR